MLWCLFYDIKVGGAERLFCLYVGVRHPSVRYCLISISHIIGEHVSQLLILLRNDNNNSTQNIIKFDLFALSYLV